MPSTPGQHLMPTLCASAPSRHPQAALLRRRRPSPPTIVRSGAALLRVHAVVADHRPAGCWRAKHRRAALPSSNSSETEAAVLGAAVPRQDYRQRRRCLLGSLARSQLASGRWWPAFATSRGGRYFIYRPPPGTPQPPDLDPAVRIKQEAPDAMTRSERRTPAPLRRPRRRPPAISGVTRTRWASHAVQPEAPPPQRRHAVLRVLPPHSVDAPRL